MPDVLLSGHHEEIRKWRRDTALRRTVERRPELLPDAALDADERQCCAWNDTGVPAEQKEKEQVMTAMEL